MLKLIQSCNVEMGMFVHDIKATWIAHPFWRSRFVVDDADVLEKVRNSDLMVMIDTDRGCDVPVRQRRLRRGGGDADARAAQATARAASDRIHFKRHWPSPTGPAGTRVIAPTAFGRADRERALGVAQRSTSAVKALFEGCLQGRALSTPIVLTVVDDIAEALRQNIHAFVSVIRLRAKDDETYIHSVAVCALMICLAQEAGLSEEAARALGTAGLLHDIGKMAIDSAILRKEGALTDEERAEIRRHPELGHSMLQQVSGLPAVAWDVCLHHHERLDGSGYPFGLAGDEVSHAARLAAVCDVYDAMTSDRPYRRGMAPAMALGKMEQACGEFDKDLVFCLMRKIGKFPPGKLVRLRSKRLAVVLPSKFEDRYPLARVFYSTVDAAVLPYEDVVLHDRSDEQAIAAEEPVRWFAADWGAMSARIIAGEPMLLPG
jgi:putative nucleotidyltransferase with HDIG domain